MTAFFTPAGGSLVQLAGSDTTGCFDQPSGIVMSADTRVQVEDLVRAELPAVFDRGNHTRQISFTVTASYSTWDDAVIANCALLTSLIGVGVFTLKNNAGSTTHLTINNAVCSFEASDGGAYCVRRFTIKGTA